MISPETRAQIRRYFYVEHWKVGTIASELGVHPDAVRNAIESERFHNSKPLGVSVVDPYIEFIRHTLEQHPRLRATRIYQMIRDRGYRGSVVGVLGQVSPGSTNFTVKVVIANPDLKLQAGFPVTATVSLPAATGIGVPTAAFLDDTHTSLMADTGNTAKVVKVREVASDGTTSIVTGLKDGDEVISDGQLGVASGQKLSD